MPPPCAILRLAARGVLARKHQGRVAAFTTRCAGTLTPAGTATGAKAPAVPAAAAARSSVSVFLILVLDATCGAASCFTLGKYASPYCKKSAKRVHRYQITRDSSVFGNLFSPEDSSTTLYIPGFVGLFHLYRPNFIPLSSATA